MKSLLTIFISVFLAELGDKTQLATLSFATEGTVRPATVFAAASAALLLSTLIAVFAGSAISRYIAPQRLQLIAGITFVAVGLWTIWSARG